MQDSTLIFIATRNPHKIAEIKSVLGEGFRCLGTDEISCDLAIVEDANTFAGNATKKAAGIANWIQPRIATLAPPASCRAFVLADDSGLEVDALDGAPGVRSARFAALDSGRAGNSSDAENNSKLLQLLKDVPIEKRTARFRCVLALVRIGAKAIGEPRLFDDACEGRIAFAPSGAKGFGYDPLFVPDGFGQSFAELGEGSKNQISHRAKALAKLKAALSEPAGW